MTWLALFICTVFYVSNRLCSLTGLNVLNVNSSIAEQETHTAWYCTYDVKMVYSGVHCTVRGCGV
jgi:uncharacterized membrane protein YhfC